MRRILVGAFAAGGCHGLMLASTVTEAGVLPELRIPLMTDAPGIDGVIGQEEWKEAARIEGLAGRIASEPGVLVPHRASCWVGADGEALYVAVVSATPPGGKLLMRAVPAPPGKNARVQLDDAVEIIISPSGGEEQAIYRLLLNARGAVASTHEQGETKEFWESAVRVRSRVEGELWSLEAKIPLTAAGVTRERLEQGIGFSVGRYWKQALNTEPQTRWSGLTTHDGASLPRLRLDPSTLVVQLKSVNDENANVALEVDLFNPHSKPVRAHVSANLRPSQSAPSTFGEQVVIEANARKTFEIRLPGAHDPQETVSVDFNVMGQENAMIYQRQFSVRGDAGGNLWELDAKAAEQVDVRFAYFPSHHEMKVAVNFKALRQQAKVAKVICSVMNREGKVLAETTLEPQAGVASLDRWEVPMLGEGEYRLRTTLLGEGEIATVFHPFARGRFPWEGTELGRSDRLVPPFSALTVEGNKVIALLREHTLTPTGLWEQVKAKGRPLLAGPMELRMGKGEAVAVAGEQRRELISDTQILTQHLFSLSGLKVEAKTRWEQDGMMLWTLELPPNPSGALEELTLVIPFEERETTLIHACTDGLRFNLAGSLPANEGTLWRSSDAPRNLMVGSYVPYIWLGSEERGIAVFGENDHGWIATGEAPMQEVIRRNGRVELHCRLIAGGSRWAKPRTIQIGFQATPTKPMPEQWRTTYMGAAPPDHIMTKYGDRIRFINFIGSTGSYGSAIQAAEPAPRKDDFTIWERLGKIRRTGTSDVELLEEWKRETTGIYEKGNPLAELNYGAHVLGQKPSEVLIYTNARGVRMDTSEGQTFIDEWITPEFSNRKVAPLAMVAYTVDPVLSYQDWMMWLYAQALDTFADHIYWDDVFLAANFDLATSAAYRLDDGKIVPASGLFNMRDLVRRTAVLGSEKGRKPFNMVHMTNTAIAPILSFAQMMYTWEDKSGVNDFQERWSKDYIRAESLGRQHGTVPIAMQLIRSGDGRAVPEEVASWAARTAAGVMISHELRANQHRPEYWEAMEPLLEFGYGTEEVAIYNYWDEAYPIAIGGGETASLLLVKGEEALLFVCDYGDGGERTARPSETGRRKILEAVNVVTGESVPVKSGAFSWTMKKHDYVIHRVKLAKE